MYCCIALAHRPLSKRPRVAAGVLDAPAEARSSQPGRAMTFASVQIASVLTRREGVSRFGLYSHPNCDRCFGLELSPHLFQHNVALSVQKTLVPSTYLVINRAMSLYGHQQNPFVQRRGPGCWSAL